MTLLTFSALIIGCYVLSYLIMHQTARVSSSSYFLFRLFLLPGVILHESAHALACVITGTPIVDISFWDERGGHVTHHKPKFPFLLQPFISLAPLPFGILSLIYLSQFIAKDAIFISAVSLLLMLSIAATLAPSKTDFTLAAWGIVFLAIIGGGVLFLFPDVNRWIAQVLLPANHQLLVVLGILIGFWIFLILFEKVIRRTH